MTVDPLLSVDALLVWCSRLGNGRTCAAASERPRGRSRPQRFWCTYAVLPVRLCRSAVPGRLGSLGVLTSQSSAAAQIMR